MADSFEVTGAALHEHARGLAGLADELQSAFDMAGRVSLTAGAYGQTCEQVVSMLNEVARAAGNVVAAGIGALDASATKLRDSADTYAAVDTGEAGTYADITGELA